MTITVNGKAAEVSGEVTIRRLLEEVNARDPLYVTVQLNGAILKAADFDVVKVKAGDVVEFLYFMGGGNFLRKLPEEFPAETPGPVFQGLGSGR